MNPFAPRWSYFLLAALSLSIGWGIRGNFGHEFGAMIPGALAAMAVVLLSGREDWHARIALFAMFGALGWSFGGSMSYMMVISYTHSGHSASVLYGFACLWLLGFLWAAPGGAATALPAFLSGKQLRTFFTPLTVLFAAWALQTVVEDLLATHAADHRHENVLYWYDTDWLAAAVGVVVMLGVAAVRRGFDPATSMGLHMAVGWWVGFLALVVAGGLRMTPPRGDNWAGCLGMVAGLFLFLHRQGWIGISLVTLVTGVIGGFGFAGASLIKLLLMKSGWQTNWHSVLEQTYGLINGLGLAVAFAWVLRRAPRTSNDDLPRFTHVYGILFVLLGVTWLNLKKNPSEWVRSKAMPALLYDGSPLAWFNAGYALLALLLAGLLLRHLRRPIALFSSPWLSRGQWLYLVFLWWMVIGNFERAVVSFSPQRLITEGVIFLNAILSTALVLATTPEARTSDQSTADWSRLFRKASLWAVPATLLFILGSWGIIRTVYGDEMGPHSGKHIRFGPNATGSSEKPKPGQAHP